MLAVLKKEIKGYFLSPIGYIYIGIFLFMFSIFFYIEVYGSGIGLLEFEKMFYSASTILTFIIPILTMRMFSEEKKTGTDQLLFTSPRSITKIVLGKFLSSTIIVIISLLLTFIYYFILMYFGSPHLSTTIVVLVGFLLLAMAYISFGMFISSITENQIIACIISIAFFLALWFLPAIFNGLYQFSLIEAFVGSFINGAIEVKDVVLLTSFSAMFIIFTTITLQRRKSLK